MSLPTLAKNFAKVTNYSFINTQLLEEALTHPSVIRSRDNIKEIKNSERLEFLGDSVLNLVVSDMLFNMFPDEKEGKLSRRKKHLVDGKTLYSVAKNIRLCDLIIKDVKNNGHCNPKSLENAIEALIGAIYIDSGLDKVREFITQYWEKIIKEKEDYDDPKTKLQEWSMNNRQPMPSYRTISETGPKHNPKFTVRANVYYLGTATATASSKKEAQVKAAEMLLKKLQNLEMKNGIIRNVNEASEQEDIKEAELK